MELIVTCNKLALYMPKLNRICRKLDGFIYPKKSKCENTEGNEMKVVLVRLFIHDPASNPFFLSFVGAIQKRRDIWNPSSMHFPLINCIETMDFFPLASIFNPLMTILEL